MHDRNDEDAQQRNLSGVELSSEIILCIVMTPPMTRTRGDTNA